MRNLVKRTLPLFLLLLLASVAGAAELKVGHVDLQRIVAQSDAGKIARESFFARNKTFQEEINSRSEGLKKLKEALDADVGRVPKGEKIPPEILEREKALGVQARDLQRLLGGYNEELKVYDTELTRKVLDEFAPILAGYAMEHYYDYIFRVAEPMVFAAEKRDLTDELIKEFNQKRRR
jgi:outer membrane protein